MFLSLLKRSNYISDSGKYPLWYDWVILLLFYFSDTDNIRFVFAAVKDTILQLNLKEYNLVWLLCGCTSCKQKQKNLEVERLTDASISIGQGHFSLWPWSILTDHTHIHTHKKINLEKCPCTWEKKTFEKKNLQKKRNKWTCSVFSWCDAQPVSGLRGAWEFFYIYYIYIYIYMNISSSSRDRQCWGSISKPQTADFFFSPLPCIFFNGFFFFFWPSPLFLFFCVTTP